MKMVYEGSLAEVEFLLTGKRFKRGKEVTVTDAEYKALKNHADFKVVKAKKEGAK
jgi:hypothetical protein